jgi:hypothetical protein
MIKLKAIFIGAALAALVGGAAAAQPVDRPMGGHMTEHTPMGPSAMPDRPMHQPMMMHRMSRQDRAMRSCQRMSHRAMMRSRSCRMMMRHHM